MSRHRSLVLAAVCCAWMFAAEGFRAAQAQVRALPPSTPYGDSRSTAVLDQSAAVLDQRLGYGAVGNALDGQLVDMGVQPGWPGLVEDYWTWQLLPDGLLYRAYLAGGRESRFASHWIYEKDKGWLWDVVLGGHVGMLRYGSENPYYPEGFQLDIEGAAFPRLTIGDYRELVSVDFRFGVPLAFRRGPWEAKFGYYHLSSHLGDEYMVRYATFDRTNYSRDVMIAGVALLPHEDLRLYAEAGWAFHMDGGTEPWEFQFGVDYSPVGRWCALGTPFFAINTRIREEVDFGGNMTVQTGLQWRGRTGQLFRAGLHYFNGKTDQYQFLTEHEEQIGIGLWYDF